MRVDARFGGGLGWARWVVRVGRQGGLGLAHLARGCGLVVACACALCVADFSRPQATLAVISLRLIFPDPKTPILIPAVTLGICEEKIQSFPVCVVCLFIS